MRALQPSVFFSLWAILVLCAVMPVTVHAGVTPDSAEVKTLIDNGLKYLASHQDQRLGGKCLVALAFLKAGRGDDVRVAEAVEACQLEAKANHDEAGLDVYSNGLAVIFLCELSPNRYGSLIEYFLDRMKKRQKPHGGWGYFQVETGDTSQTQYAALSYWQANRHGFALEGESIDKLANWLQKTQDPEGCWGYQGTPTTTDTPVPQDDPTCSMLAAGLGCTYICADLFGIHAQPTAVPPTRAATGESNGLPSALKRVDQNGRAGGPKQYRPLKANTAKLLQSMSRAQNWLKAHYTIDQQTKSYYYLYGLERFKSFQEVFEGTSDPSPKWYNDGFQFLASKQAEDGSWSGYCGKECDTAFAILFLLRSTKKSLDAKLGEGMLVAGRGLPQNLARAKLRNGELVVEQVHTKIDQLLTMIDDGNDATLDDLARDPSQLVVDNVDEKSARRLQQLVRGGEPEVRLLAVRALGRTGNLDYVPSLLYALTDPDRRVVLEARNELRFISRSFDGIGPPDDFNEQQRYQAIEAWKKWYLAIRPTAVLEK